MGQAEVLKAGLYLIELIRAALCDDKADEKEDDINWNLVYHLAKKNSADGLSAYGVETLANKPPEEIWMKWSKAPQITTYRMLSFDIEREKILNELKKAGISYMPLKGVHIAGYYPKPGMRSMSDNDILYKLQNEDDVEKVRKIVKSIMKKLNYVQADFNDADDSFHKKPMFNFEMHRTLFSKNTQFYEYYKNPWERWIQDEGDTNGYHFSDEDEFIYFLSHAYKHFSNAGCGIRLLTDTYVFLEKKEETMDWKYVNEELSKIGLLDFKEMIIDLSKKIFLYKEKKFTEVDTELLLFLLKCGTFGTIENVVALKVKSLTSSEREKRDVKVKYLIRRIFPDDEWWREFCPMGYEKKYLRPFFLTGRTIKAILFKSERIKTEWKALNKKDN